MVIEYVADGKLLRAADQEEHFLEDIAADEPLALMRKGACAAARKDAPKEHVVSDEMYHSWAGMGMLQHELQTNMFWTISK